MFYRPQDGHGLPHNPFNAIVAPRPIAWISTRDSAGRDNLAPYSFFNAVAYEPPQLMFSSTGRKDSVSAIEETGVFAVNVVSYDQRDLMNATSQTHPRGVDEFTQAGIERAECQTIDCPRVALAPATLECRLSEVIVLKGRENLMVLGEVTGVHMRDDCVIDGRFDLNLARPLARLGYRDYAQLGPLFELLRPGQK